MGVVSAATNPAQSYAQGSTRSHGNRMCEIASKEACCSIYAGSYLRAERCSSTQAIGGRRKRKKCLKTKRSTKSTCGGKYKQTKTTQPIFRILKGQGLFSDLIPLWYYCGWEPSSLLYFVTDSSRHSEVTESCWKQKAQSSKRNFSSPIPLGSQQTRENFRVFFSGLPLSSISTTTHPLQPNPQPLPGPAADHSERVYLTVVAQLSTGDRENTTQKEKWCMHHLQLETWRCSPHMCKNTEQNPSLLFEAHTH